MTGDEQGFGVRAVIVFFVYVLGIPLLLFVAAGDWTWGMGWVFYAMHVLVSLGGRVLILMRDPSLLAERARFGSQEDAASYERFLAPFVGLLGPLLSYVLMGLDHRFGWTPAFPGWLAWGAMFLNTVMYVFASWALVANAFFSGVMRLQEERGHQVISSGPYALVRHPGYAGALGAYLFTPFALSTLWGLAMSALLTIALVLRTSLEDRTLHAELDGYKDYARRVRWRLVPGIW